MSGRVRSRSLVVDTNVFRAAAACAEAKHPGGACHEVLDRMLRICHRLVLSGPMLEEWHRHGSRWASHWLTAMFARKKVDRVSSDGFDEDRERWSNCASKPSESRVIAKDAHLVSMAQRSDARVISMDDEARRAFRALARARGELGHLLWFDPAGEERILEWLGEGAPLDGWEHRRLGSE